MNLFSLTPTLVQVRDGVLIPVEAESMFCRHQKKDGTKFGVYQGTADAINQNIDFIDEFNPSYVLILSGDHIYKMDYDQMLDFHKKNDADLTVAVRPVPWEEAPRFGIMNVDMNNRIDEFQENLPNQSPTWLRWVFTFLTGHCCVKP